MNEQMKATVNLNDECTIYNKLETHITQDET